MSANFAATQVLIRSSETSVYSGVCDVVVILTGSTNLSNEFLSRVIFSAFRLS